MSVSLSNRCVHYPDAYDIAELCTEGMWRVFWDIPDVVADILEFDDCFVLAWMFPIRIGVVYRSMKLLFQPSTGAVMMI